jgi:hypothetical protein
MMTNSPAANAAASPGAEVELVDLSKIWSTAMNNHDQARSLRRVHTARHLTGTRYLADQIEFWTAR